jgi:hypothetical protein
MAIVRLEAFKSLAARIESAVPALVGKVKCAQAPSSTEQTYPTLTIIPGTFKYEPHQESEHATIGDPADGNVVFNVGAHSGPVQLRIVATTIGERMSLEQSVTNFFMSQEMRPGIVITEVTACAELGRWIAAFEYDSDQWVDIEAFDRKLESLVIVNGIVPALVARTEVYEINELVLGMTADFDTTFTTDTMVPPVVELVLINEDGTISPYP